MELHFNAAVSALDFPIGIVNVDSNGLLVEARTFKTKAGSPAEAEAEAKAASLAAIQCARTANAGHLLL